MTKVSILLEELYEGRNCIKDGVITLLQPREVRTPFEVYREDDTAPFPYYDHVDMGVQLTVPVGHIAIITPEVAALDTQHLGQGTWRITLPFQGQPEGNGVGNVVANVVIVPINTNIVETSYECH